MESFAFKAATPQGKVIEGVRDAASRTSLIEELRAGGFIPIRIDAAGESRKLASLVRLPAFRRGISLSAITLLFKELATMLSAGIAADRAIAIAARTARDAKLQEALVSVRESLRGGAPFSSALRQGLPGLPRAALSLIEAGESAGGLGAAFDKVSRMLEAQLALRQNLISALIYPTILLVTTIAAILFLLTFVVPQFKTVFADAGASLPLPTLILIVVGDGLEHYGPLALTAVLVGVLVLVNWRATSEGRAAIDRYCLRLPIVGGLIARFEIARIARTLSSLVAAKVPLARALGLTAEGIANTQLKDGFRSASARAKEGERLGPALAAGGAWPVDAIELVTIGEESGRLDLMLANLADLYEADIKRRTDRFLTVLTPALTLVMGGIVAAIMGAVISAILGAYDLPG